MQPPKGPLVANAAGGPFASHGYAQPMAQLVRAIRRAAGRLLARRRNAEIGRAIVAEYEARPQTAIEVGWTDAATLAMIEREPW